MKKPIQNLPPDEKNSTAPDFVRRKASNPDEIDKLAARATSREEFFADLAMIRFKIEPADSRLFEMFGGKPLTSLRPTGRPLPPRKQ